MLHISKNILYQLYFLSFSGALWIKWALWVDLGPRPSSTKVSLGNQSPKKTGLEESSCCQNLTEKRKFPPMNGSGDDTQRRGGAGYAV